MCQFVQPALPRRRLLARPLVIVLGTPHASTRMRSFQYVRTRGAMEIAASTPVGGPRLPQVVELEPATRTGGAGTFPILTF